MKGTFVFGEREVQICHCNSNIVAVISVKKYFIVLLSNDFLSVLFVNRRKTILFIYIFLLFFSGTSRNLFFIKTRYEHKCNLKTVGRNTKGNACIFIAVETGLPCLSFCLLIKIENVFLRFDLHVPDSGTYHKLEACNCNK